MNDPWFVCWEKDCRIRGVRQYLRRTMTGRQGFDGHHRTTHQGGAR